MAWNKHGQKGEGKVGCIITLLVFLILGGAAFKIVPYWWAVDQLASTADELASRAGVLKVQTVQSQLKSKALELELIEAIAPGAIGVSMTEGGNTGMCTITLKFTREIDMYGVTKVRWDTDKNITKPWGRF